MLVSRLRTPGVLDLGIAAAVVLFAAAPAIFTHWGFGPDFTNHLWLMWHQAEAIGNTGHPSLYLSSPTTGILEPWYGFYGGTLYAATGTISTLLGHRPNVAYVISIVAAMAMAYGGTWWLGRLVGLGRRLAHLPAFVFVTSAYYLADIYARGAWPEWVALSALPLIVAGGVALLMGRVTAASLGLFALGCIVLSGSHNISLLWYTIVILVGAAVALPLLGPDRPRLRAIAVVAAVAALSLGVNFWFLLLDVLHSGDTNAGARSGFDWGFTALFNTPEALLNPFRITPPGSTTFRLSVTAPILALVVAIVLVFDARREVRTAPRSLWRMWWLGLGLFVALLLLMMSETAWEVLGQPFTLIQFPYRLAGPLAFILVAVMAVGLSLAQSAAWTRRVIPAVAGGLVLITLAQAGPQLWDGEVLKTSTLGHNRFGAFAHGPNGTPDWWYDPNSYGDASRPLVEVDPQRRIDLPIPAPGETRSSAVVRLPSGSAPILTNVAGGPYVVRIEGAKVIGRSGDGRAVIESPTSGPRTRRITAVGDAGAVGTIGTIVSIVSALALVAWTAVLALRARRANRDPEHDDVAAVAAVAAPPPPPPVRTPAD